MESKICEKCGAKFEYVLNPKYPRKYCPKCSAEVKAAYEAKQGESSLSGQEQKPKAELMSSKDIMIVSQCLTKAFVASKYEDPQVILDAYRFFVLELENNG